MADKIAQRRPGLNMGFAIVVKRVAKAPFEGRLKGAYLFRFDPPITFGNRREPLKVGLIARRSNDKRSHFRYCRI